MSATVSVVIPTYNRARLLPEALDSALAQPWPGLEIVVVDDGSTDSTPAVIADYGARHPGVIRALRQANAGESIARNAGIEIAQSDFVAFLDSDNRWAPDKLQKQMSLFLSDPTLEFAFTGYVVFGDVPRQPVLLPSWHDSTEFALEQLLAGCCVNTSTVVARRSLFSRVGLFDPTLRCCEDHDLWLRIATAGIRMRYIREALTDYRVHGGSVSGDPALSSLSAETVFQKLFASGTLPRPFQARSRFYLSRCYLNSACRYFEAGDGRQARRSLLRAFASRPASLRPGWLRMLIRSVAMRRRR